jgi:hypothetical protein
MYVTPKMVDRWKENPLVMHRRAVCWKATYGPNIEAYAHVRDSKDVDGRPWPEWTGELPYDHPSNHTREDTRERLGQITKVPDYAQLVNAMEDERITAEMCMAHLSVHIRIGHALQEKERRSVGKQSPRNDIAKAKDVCICRFTEDRIEVMQYLRGRIGDDRDAILAMQCRPYPDLTERPPSALSRGKERFEGVAGECAMEPAPKRTRTTETQAQHSPSTATNGRWEWVRPADAEPLRHGQQQRLLAGK